MNNIKKTIIISGLPNSGKSTLTKELSKRLNIPVYSIGTVFKEKFKELKEKNKIEKNITFHEWWNSLDDETQKKVNSEMNDKAKKGNIILDLRYSFTLKEIVPDALFVFLKADIDIRVKRTKDNPLYHNMNLEEIKIFLKQREDDEVKKGLLLFKEDYRKDSHYNLILDSGELNTSQEVSRILKEIV